MGNFEFQKTQLENAILITSFFSGDNRGGFTKSFEKDIYKKAGIDFALNETFVSVSAKNVIRGMHFQLRNPQAKLVCVPKGAVYDVIVDLRPASSTYRKWQGFELNDENHNVLYVPRGFAHGFLSLKDDTYMLYQCDGAYDKETDTGIRYDDPVLNIVWPIENLDLSIHSERDLKLMSFVEYEKGLKNYEDIS